MNEINNTLKNINLLFKRSGSANSDDENKFPESNPIKNIYDENFTEIRSIVIFKAIFELFATFLFIFLIILCEKDISKFILGMWIILIVFGNFSGAHLNPAISLGFYINKAKYSAGLFKLAMYIIAQFLGCFLGILVSFLLKGKVDNLSIPDKNILRVLFSEMFFTGTLFFIIILVSFPQTTPTSKGYINALFIVCWFFVIVNAGALISGAAFNPAVLLSMNTIAMFARVQETRRDFSKLISMIIAQFTGVIIFAFIYKNIVLKFHINEELKKKRFDGEGGNIEKDEKKIEIIHNENINVSKNSNDVKNEIE